jgi:hypothetical protein
MTVAYCVSPIDLIPDFIPILGLLDDFLLLPGTVGVHCVAVALNMRTCAHGHTSPQHASTSHSLINALTRTSTHTYNTSSTAGMLWIVIKIIPADVMADAHERAASEPLRISKNWVAAAIFFIIWDVLLLWCAFWAVRYFGSEAFVARWLWVILGGVAAALVAAEGAWSVLEIRAERRTAQHSEAPELVTGLLSQEDQEVAGAEEP